MEVKEHFQAKSKWCDRMSLNLPTQGGGAIVLKDACITWFNWVVDNGYFGKILLVNLTHDEINTEFPEELKETYPSMMAKIMQDSAAKYYHKLPIPAVPEVGDHWIH
jgi:DNA polymerase I-like protein with 3'-5' exonuclease and polymerase domains